MTGKEMSIILADADIRVTEASQLFRVAKSTVYRWLEDAAKPKQVQTYETASKLTEFIRDAVTRGYLPCRDVKGKARLGAIKGAIKQVAIDRGTVLR